MPSFQTASRLPNVPNLGGRYAIAATDQLHRNLNEKGFAFRFTCNNDERVYYNAYFLKQTIIYSNKFSQRVNGIEVHYDIDLTDCYKLTRDFENITEDDLYKVIDQLMPLCTEQLNKGNLNNDNIVFNVNML